MSTYLSQRRILLANCREALSTEGFSIRNPPPKDHYLYFYYLKLKDRPKMPVKVAYTPEQKVVKKKKRYDADNRRFQKKVDKANFSDLEHKMGVTGRASYNSRTGKLIAQVIVESWGDLVENME
jgi:hypothetical protein